MEDARKPILSVCNVSLKFGGLAALTDISFDCYPGEVLGLVGPNGAGKTSLFNCLNRIYRPASGDIIFEGRSILKVPRSNSAEMGIARTFQNLALFPSMTVLENVIIGVHSQIKSNLLSDMLKVQWFTKNGNEARDIAMNLISFLNLDLVASKLVSGLSYGILKRVELARALAAHPKLLLLDEPAGGLSQTEIAELRDIISKLRSKGEMAQVLVEHNMALVMSLCDRIIVLDAGKVIANDVPEKIRTNDAVIRAYLGGAN